MPVPSSKRVVCAAARDNASNDARSGDAQARGTSMQREVEYQTGRRVEQVVSQPGSIRRIHVVAVVRQPLDAQQQEQVRRLVAVAVGASPERGDAVVVQSMQAATVAAAAVPDIPPAPAAMPPAGGAPADVPLPWSVAALGAVIASLAAVLALRLRRPRAAAAARLTEDQRQVALRRVEAWLLDGDRTRSAGTSLLGATGDAG